MQIAQVDSPFLLSSHDRREVKHHAFIVRSRRTTSKQFQLMEEKLTVNLNTVARQNEVWKEFECEDLVFDFRFLLD